MRKLKWIAGRQGVHDMTVMAGCRLNGGRIQDGD
jgi:hypothetical protein